MTSVDNKAFVQMLMDARSRGDHRPFQNAMADEFVWRISGGSAWSSTYAGKADIRERLLKPLYEQLTEPTRLTASRILADGDFVVVECQGEATTKHGQRYANTYCFVLRVEGGQLKEMTEYMDTALVERVLTPPLWSRSEPPVLP